MHLFLNFVQGCSDDFQLESIGNVGGFCLSCSFSSKHIFSVRRLDGEKANFFTSHSHCSIHVFPSRRATKFTWQMEIRLSLFKGTNSKQAFEWLDYTLRDVSYEI